MIADLEPRLYKEKPVSLSYLVDLHLAALRHYELVGHRCDCHVCQFLDEEEKLNERMGR